MTAALLAYHNDPAIKADALAHIRAHAEADKLVKGQYWQAGKGCAVGCQIHSGNHFEYETRFGIPVALARLEDAIFEGLPNTEAMAWPIRFMAAPREGQDLSRVHWGLMLWLLTDASINPGINHPLVRDAVRQCAGVIAQLKDGADCREVESAAWSAARSAEIAASAAASAAESAAESAAWSAESAAWSAASAASAARSAAESAAWSAESAESAAWSATLSAESAAWVKIADKLIELIHAAPMGKGA